MLPFLLACSQPVTTGAADVSDGPLPWREPEKLELIEPSPFGTARYTAISAGTSHVCALDLAGAVRCVGEDVHGETAPSAGPWTWVSAGNRRTCAGRGDGTHLCWGRERWIGWPPGGLSEVTQDRWSTCVRTIDGTRKCWSEFNGDAFVLPAVDLARAAPGLGRVCAKFAGEPRIGCWGTKGELPVPAGEWRDVAAGMGTTCGVRGDGTLQCWGRKGLPFTGFPELRDFVSVDVADRHVCALRTNGSLACYPGRWMERDGPYVQLAVGATFGCALKAAGGVDCWGDIPS